MPAWRIVFCPLRRRCISAGPFGGGRSADASGPRTSWGEHRAGGTMGESSMPGRSPTRPVRERHVRDLLGRMTLAEKVGHICATLLPPAGSEIPAEVLDR